jgi:hypothetical protein
MHLLTLVLLIIFSQEIVAQTVWTVDNRPESAAQYTSVQAAINDDVNVLDGDILYIHPSPTSYGNITLDKSLTLIGPGHDPSNSNGLRATLGIVTLAANCLNSVITGLTMQFFTAYSFGSNAAGIHIINNRITGNNGSTGSFSPSNTPNWVIEGNYWDNTSSASANIDVRGNDWILRNNFFSGRIGTPNRTTIITNNLFVNQDTSGTATIFESSSDITSPIVTNNMFIFTDPDVTEITSTGSTPIVYTNCLTWNEGEGGASDLVVLSGSGNLNNQNPLFTSIPTSVHDFYNNDYTLGGGSPAIGTATDTGDIGVFGRGFPFDIHGRPHSMSYPTEMTILNSVVQPGQDLNVQFKATQKN